MQIYSLKVNTLAQSVGEAWMEEEAEMMTELFHSELDLSPVVADNALEQKAEIIAESTVTAEVSQEREFSAEKVPQEHAEVLQGEAVGAGEVPREHAGVVPQEHGSPVQRAKRGRGQSGIDNGEAEGEGKAGERRVQRRSAGKRPGEEGLGGPGADGAEKPGENTAEGSGQGGKSNRQKTPAANGPKPAAKGKAKAKAKNKDSTSAAASGSNKKEKGTAIEDAKKVADAEKVAQQHKFTISSLLVRKPDP